MSEASIAARKAMHEKIKRITKAETGKVDGSDFTPAEPLLTESKTGARPISPRQYKRGGKVEGIHAKVRADRKARKDGGRAKLTPDNFLNRDVKEANEERGGSKHVGGWKKGGRIGKMDGGSFVPTNRLPSVGVNSRMDQAAGLKRGGKAHKASGGALGKDEMEAVSKVMGNRNPKTGLRPRTDKADEEIFDKAPS